MSQTRPYSELLSLVESLTGSDDLSTSEKTRIKYFANSRARKAYRETDYWPRWLVTGEERVISSAGVMPLSETGRSTIDTVLRLHASDPFGTVGACEYQNWHVSNDGVNVTNYRTRAYSNDGTFTISGTLTPDITGTIYQISADGATYPEYTDTGDLTTYPLTYVYRSFGSWAINYREAAGVNTATWFSTNDPTAVTDVTWSPSIGATGTPTIAAATVYAIYATYKKQMDVTYGDASGETTTVPEEWWEYMARGAYADWLRSEGQTEKAALEEIAAMELLNQQLEKVTRNGGFDYMTRVNTHNTRQFR